MTRARARGRTAVPGFVVKDGRERPRVFELTEGAMEIVDSP
jgi:hypothetical protein